MRGLINALTNKLKALSDDEVVRLSRAAEIERVAAAAIDQWSVILDALRPRLNLLRPARSPSVSRLFFEPIQDLLVDERRGKKRPGEIHRGSLEPIWTWLSKSDAADTIQAAKAQILKSKHTAENQALASIVDSIRVAATDAMFDALLETDPYVIGENSLAAALGDPRIVDDFREIAMCMTVAKELTSLRTCLPESFDVITTDHIESAHKIFDAIESIDSGLSYLVPMIHFRRLTQPWEALRLCVSVNVSNVERSLSRPDFRLVFEYLLDLLRVELEAFDRTADEDVHKLLSHLKTFSDTYMGISELVNLQKKSQLGSALLACRNDFSKQIAARVRSVSGSLCQAIPDDYSKSSAATMLMDPDTLAEVCLKVGAMADFIGQVSRLSHMTDLYFGIDQDIKTLNEQLDKRLVALTQAYRQKFAPSSDILDQYYEVLAPAVRRLSGSDSEDRLNAVKTS